MQYQVAIVGAGVSGMTTALYLKRAGISCCIIEKSAPGGQINFTSEIENYPGNPNILGPDLAFNIYQQLESLDIPFIFEEVLEIKNKRKEKIIVTNKQEIKAKYLVIATGRSPRKLNIAKEDKLIGKGISYCAICDGPLYKDKEVVVIGGGDSAVKEALFLSNLCKKVTLIHRNNTFRTKEDISELENKDNIVIKLNSEVAEFVTEADKLSKVILKNKEEINCSGCFIFIGYIPETEEFASLAIIDQEGYIITDKNCKTKLSNIYAIGDVRKKGFFQILTAMNDAVIVAKSIIDKN